jgi:hypothetical protein
MSINNLYPEVSPSLLLDFANVKKLDPRITFARASTGAYYDGQTVTKAEQNLFIYSQNSTTGWTNFSSILTITPSYEAAPDGTTTGMRLQNSSGGLGYFYQFVGSNSLISGITYTISVWVKSNTGSTQTADLMMPVTSYTNPISVTTSWTRVTWTSTLALTNSYAGIILNPATATDISVWGFQLEQRGTVTAYTPTTTQPITNYIPTLLTAPANTARFDHNPVTGESLGLLVEEQRTNLNTYSAQFNITYSPVNLTVATNTIIAPDGTLTGDQIVESTATDFHRIDKAFTTTSVLTTFSIYAKSNGRDFLYIGGYDNLVVSRSAFFNVSNGTLGVADTGVTSKIESVGNGWYRCSMTIVAYNGGGNTYKIGMAQTDNIPFYTGDGYSGIYIWGAQLEVGSFPTSYIPTVASQVTRSADSASMTGTNFSDWYRADEFTTLVDYVGNSQNPTSANQLIFSFGPGGYNAANSLISIINSAGLVTVWNFSGVSYSVSAQSRSTSGKLAFSYDANATASVVNGGTVATGSSSSSVGLINSISFGKEVSPIPALNGHIKKFAYYPQRLSNENLQALTS